MGAIIEAKQGAWKKEEIHWYGRSIIYMQNLLQKTLKATGSSYLILKLGQTWI